MLGLSRTSVTAKDQKPHRVPLSIIELFARANAMCRDKEITAETNYEIGRLIVELKLEEAEEELKKLTK